MKCQRTTVNMSSEAPPPFCLVPSPAGRPLWHTQAQGFLLSKRATQLLLSSALFDFFFLPNPCAKALPTEQSLGSFSGRAVSLEGGSRLLAADSQAEDQHRVKQ